ncbi:MAG: hypothetical protein WBL85_07525 [Sedimentisphaerales bacterium]
MSEEPKQSDGRPGDTRASSATQVGIVVKDVILDLQGSRFEKAADLFLKAQEKGILPGDRDIVKKLLDVLGENTANQLITAFAFHPCQFCTKGRTQCEVCNGCGHIEQEAVCERCFGLGMTRCGFCNGSSLLALSDIPAGIRTPAIIKRAEKTIEDANSVLNVPIPEPSQDKPAATLHKCATLWAVVDKLMGTFEDIVVASQTSIVSPEFEKPLKDVVQKAILMGAELEEQLRNIIVVMQKSAQMEAQRFPPDSSHAKRAKNLAVFYQSLSGKSAFFYNLADAHPLLEDAIERNIADKSAKDAGGQKPA